LLFRCRHAVVIMQTLNWTNQCPLFMTVRHIFEISEDDLTDRYRRVALDGTFSDWLPVTSGVPQGSILGSLLFVLYVNDVPNYIQYNSTWITLFADDSKLFKPILDSTSSYNLQSDLDCLQSWSLDWGMAFNKSKCKVMNISTKKTLIREAMYTMDNQSLDCVPFITDLGVTVSNDLSWSRHIESIVAKANKTLGLVKRVFKELPDLKVRKLSVYCALVRPKLEYASSLWSPYTVKYPFLNWERPAAGHKIYTELSSVCVIYRETCQNQSSSPWISQRNCRF
jgi:hypothetical protein